MLMRSNYALTLMKMSSELSKLSMEMEAGAGAGVGGGYGDGYGLVAAATMFVNEVEALVGIDKTSSLKNVFVVGQEVVGFDVISVVVVVVEYDYG